MRFDLPTAAVSKKMLWAGRIIGAADAVSAAGRHHETVQADVCDRCNGPARIPGERHFRARGCFDDLYDSVCDSKDFRSGSDPFNGLPGWHLSRPTFAPMRACFRFPSRSSLACWSGEGSCCAIASCDCWSRCDDHRCTLDTIGSENEIAGETVRCGSSVHRFDGMTKAIRKLIAPQGLTLRGILASKTPCQTKVFDRTPRLSTTSIDVIAAHMAEE